MSRFIEIKSVNPKLGLDQIKKDLGCSNATQQRYRQDINMPSPCRIPSNSHKRRQKTPNTNLDVNSHRKRDLKRFQMTLNNLKRPKKFSNDLKNGFNRYSHNE